MRRREFITLLGGAAAAWPLAARAQQPDRIRLIGALMNTEANDPNASAEMTAFVGELQKRGWTLGGNLQIEYRWGAGDANRYRKFAAELVALTPDVILAVGGTATGALQQASRTVPIVFVDTCVYRKFDSGWTRRTDGISSRPDEGSAQADSRRPAFALQVESKAGSRNPDPAATDQCASPAGTETTALQQYRSFSVCLALSLVPLRPWRDSDYQARDNHSLAPRWISSVLALAIAQPCWQTEGLG